MLGVKERAGNCCAFTYYDRKQWLNYQQRSTASVLVHTGALGVELNATMVQTTTISMWCCIQKHEFNS